MQSYLDFVCHLTVCPQTIHIKRIAQIHKYDVEYIFNLLKSNKQELTLEDHLEIRK